MACEWCGAFKADPRESEPKRDKTQPYGDFLIDYVSNTTGKCTIEPEWKPVTGLHFCSRFISGRPGLMKDFWVRMHRYMDEASLANDWRGSLNKSHKEARSEIHALKKQVRELKKQVDQERLAGAAIHRLIVRKI